MPWAPESNGYVYSLAVGENAVYAGGIFSRINGLSRKGLAAIHPTSGATEPFSAGLDAANPLHVGNTGAWTYYDYLWGGLLNAPADEG